MSVLDELRRLLPELVTLGGAVLGLLVGMFLPRTRQWVVSAIASAALVAAIALAAAGAFDADRTVFVESYAIDAGLHVTRIVVFASTLLVIALSRDWVRDHPRETEFVVLLLLASLGTVALAGASDLLLLSAAYLLASVPLYALAGFGKDAAGTEAALKLYLLGSFLGIVLIAGATVLYGVGGTTTYAGLAEGLRDAPAPAVAVGLVGVLAGLAFKAGAVPGHFWVPDVTEGASAPVAAFVTTIPKVGALVAIYRLAAEAVGSSTVDWPVLVAVLAAASMTLGNLAAFFQDNVRRLLAYSTVSQVGYLLMGVAVAGRSDLALPSTLYYVAAYAVTNLGAFAVVVALPRVRTLGDFAGLFRVRAALALTVVVCLLGLVGSPPTSVFVGKVSIFSAAFDGDMEWLVVVAAVNTVASVFYYLRWIAPLFTAEPDGAPRTAGPWVLGAAYTAGLASVALGLLGGVVLDALPEVLTAR